MGVYLAKPKTDKLSEEGGDLSEMLSAFGVASMQGWRQTMEDAHIAVPSLKRCCPGAIEALRALEREQRKSEAEGKLGIPEDSRKQVDLSSSSGRDTLAEEHEKHKNGKRAADVKQEGDKEIMRTSSTDAAGDSSTSQQPGSQAASSDDNTRCAEDEASEDISLYAVFDGHASNAVSCWVSDHYLKIFAECLERVQQEAAQGHMPEGLAVGPPEAVSIFKLRNAAICEALQQSFLEVDEQMQKEDNRRALKKYYEEGQMEQKDDETYIQKYLSDGGDVRLVEMEGQKFLQFVPKTNEDEDESANKESEEHGGDTTASPAGSSSPAAGDSSEQKDDTATGASEEHTSETGQQQQQQQEEGASPVTEGDKEHEKTQEQSEKSASAGDASSSGVSRKEGDKDDGTSAEGKGSDTAKDSGAHERKDATDEKSKDAASTEEKASGSSTSAARLITRFNSTADLTPSELTSASGDVTSKSPREQSQQAKTEETEPAEEKKRTAGETTSEEDVDMEDAHASEERRDGNKRERRRRKEHSDEDKKAEHEDSEGEASPGHATTEAETEDAGKAEKLGIEEEDTAARADSGDDEDEDDDVFGRREGTNGGERTPLFAHPSTPEGSGATAVVVLVVGGPEPVVVTANAGDSRGVICRGGQAFPLSHDHKPTNPDEKARIFAAGGIVTNGRVDGNLNLSRAVGDLFYKRNREVPAKAQRITAFPDVRITRICEDDEFLVLACDGIWDCKTNQEAVDFVRERLRRAGTSDTATLRRICEELCDDCLAEDPLQSEGHGCDNMTCLVVELSSHVKKHRARALRREEKIVLYGGGDDKYLGCEEKQFESDDNDD